MYNLVVSSTDLSFTQRKDIPFLLTKNALYGLTSTISIPLVFCVGGLYSLYTWYNKKQKLPILNPKLNFSQDISQQQVPLAGSNPVLEHFKQQSYIQEILAHHGDMIEEYISILPEEIFEKRIGTLGSYLENQSIKRSNYALSENVINALKNYHLSPENYRACIGIPIQHVTS